MLRAWRPTNRTVMPNSLTPPIVAPPVNDCRCHLAAATVSRRRLPTLWFASVLEREHYRVRRFLISANYCPDSLPVLRGRSKAIWILLLDGFDLGLGNATGIPLWGRGPILDDEA